MLAPFFMNGYFFNDTRRSARTAASLNSRQGARAPAATNAHRLFVGNRRQNTALAFKGLAGVEDGVVADPEHVAILPFEVDA